MTQTTTQLSPDRVRSAYGALASGNMEQIREYWAEDMVWLVPGHNPLSGTYNGLDGFLGFMGNVGALSGSSFNMESIAVMTSD
ncbi:MAG: nuclear transport factor 2 family protein [Chloroflexia bacterium]